MDALSRILECVRCESARFISAELSAPWSLRSDFGRLALLGAHPGAAHVVSFCFVVEGRCRVRRAGSGPIDEARAGDLLLFLGADRHLLGSDLHVAPLEEVEAGAGPDASRSDDPAPLVHGGGGDVTRVVLCSLACSASMEGAWLETLPSLVRIHGGSEAEAWVLRELLRVGVMGSRAVRAGADPVLARLGEVVLVDALRRYAEEVPPVGTEWRARARDERVGHALALLHAEPGRAWTLDELARTVALSRSALAERFLRQVGQPPMRYLTRWRLALAAQTLRSGAEAIVRIAERAGYDSGAAFSRAFQREFGMPPARWRRRALA